MTNPDTPCDQVQAPPMTNPSPECDHRSTEKGVDFDLVRLEARPVDGSQEWTRIYPSQLGWVAKLGHELRALEGEPAPQVREALRSHLSLREEFVAGKSHWRIVEVYPEQRIILEDFGADRIKAEKAFAAGRATPTAEHPAAQVREALEREIEKWETDERFNYPDSDVLESLERIRAALTAERPEAAVAWRVRVRVGSMTCHAYTERLPFEPLEGSGTVVLSEPEPLYAIPHEEPGRETMTSGPGDDE